MTKADQVRMLADVIAEMQQRLEHARSCSIVAERMAADGEERYGELKRERDELLREVADQRAALDVLIGTNEEPEDE